jgi:choice-of-anchor A domain-containing protein
MKHINYILSTACFLLAGMTSLPAAVDLGIVMARYSVVTFGDYRPRNEVEGSILTGGTLQNSQTIQAHVNGVLAVSEYSIASYGGITGTNTIHVQQGSVLSRLSTTTPLNMNSGGSVQTGDRAWADFEMTLGGTMADLKSDFTNLSSRLASMSPDGLFNAGDANRFTLSGSGQAISIINITTAQLEAARGLETSMNGSQILVINVTGSTFNLDANFLGGSTANSAQVLFNFVNATDISFRNRVQGTVLAVGANVAADKGGEGAFIVQSLSHGDEIHFRPLLAIPEPGTVALLLTAVGMMFIIGRKRHRLTPLTTAIPAKTLV